MWTSPDGFVWSRVPHDAAVFGGEDKNQSMNSVAQGGPGLVAVGEELTFSGDDGDAAVWTSPDGITWTLVPHDETVFGGEGFQEMSSVVASGDGVVAVGDDGSPAAVWNSPDGLTWAQVPHEGVFGGDAIMLSVTVVGQDLVAVGFAVVDGDIDAAVWSSPDGVTWIRVAHEESLFGGEETQRMISVTVGSTGVVAVGDERVSRDAVAAVWVALHDK